MSASDANFAGSIPGLYDRYLGPLLFEPYAEEVVRRAQAFMPGHVLETAAGTGIVTAILHQSLSDAEIIATDLNAAMLEVAAERVNSDKVCFEVADAQALRFADESFDLVVCQFGAMFFPDKVKANREVRRVLRDGGRYLSVVWNSMDRNPASQLAHQALTDLYPDDPPMFLARGPFGYADPAQIERDLRSAGFSNVEIETVDLSSGPLSASDAATGLVAGSPLRSEIEDRHPDGLDSAIVAATQALHALEKDGRLDSRLSAHVVTAIK
jgi:SAM-dependent methyltransferase